MFYLKNIIYLSKILRALLSNKNGILHFWKKVNNSIATKLHVTLKNWLRKLMRSFEVYSNESACRKSGRLGLHQVLCISSHQLPIGYVHPRDGRKGMVDRVSSRENTNTPPRFLGVELHGVYVFCLVGRPRYFCKCDVIEHC